MKQTSESNREDLMMSLDQLDQTLEVLGIVIRKLKFNLEALNPQDIHQLAPELPELLDKLKLH